MLTMYYLRESIKEDGSYIRSMGQKDVVNPKAGRDLVDHWNAMGGMLGYPIWRFKVHEFKPKETG